MPRIPDEAIDRIKREVSVADLAKARGVVLRGHGENLIGLCPFHDDREPSLVITPSKNLWNCLGACQKGGDVIRWVEIAERVPFRSGLLPSPDLSARFTRPARRRGGEADATVQQLDRLTPASPRTSHR